MTTHLFCIIDRSGSMAGLEKATINGYNEYIGTLRKQKNVRLTTVLFDDQYEILYDDEPINSVSKLNRETYYVRGGTALVDAVCKTLNNYKHNVRKGDKALVLVITDGMENSSTKYASKDMRKLIGSLTERKNWTFTYLGANQDAWDVSQKWGFAQGNVSVYNSTPTGTSGAFRTMSVNSAAFAASSSTNSSMFYSAEDKKKLEESE